MKIKVTWYQHDEYGELQEMFIDGEYVARAGGDEPEDMIVGRNVMSLVEVAGLMNRAYEAGKNGEPWEYESKETK